MSDRLLGWLGIIALLLIFRGLRAVFRRQPNAGDSMARINAAAQRVLKEQKATQQNPGKAPKPARQPWNTGKTPAKNPGRQHAQNAPRSQASRAPRPITAPNTGAVTRRGGILSAGSEPVIQRRR